MALSEIMLGMTFVVSTSIVILGTLAVVAAGLYFLLRARSMDKWIGTYVRQCRRRGMPKDRTPVHVLLCVADHFEPHNEKVDDAHASARVQRWITDYPRLFDRFRDADGKTPRHTFFFPIEQYDESHVGKLTDLCRSGFGEIEIHLHHNGDTADHLRQRLLADTRLLRDRHGLLANHKQTGDLRYGFIHGNWALDNSHPLGHHCGVNNELDVLRETGCYADFTMPSAPDPTQTRKINSIYYAVDDPSRPKSHNWGIDVGYGPAPAAALLLIQGPLLLDWRRRKAGLLPRIENGCIQSNQPPTLDRMDLWLRARVQVPARPDWFFVKLHTHGTPEANQAVLLGEPMIRFHEGLASRAAHDSNFHFHYVTAREMYNLAKAAESGWTGTVSEARDFELVW